LEKGSFKHQEKFWLKEFEGGIPVLDIPTDYPRPATQSFEGDIIGFDFGPGETKALNEMARLQKATLFMVLLAIFNILLSKISNQEDIVVGTAVAGRRHADLNQIIGIFINLLPLRNFPTGEKSFINFLKEVKERTLKAFANQDYQFEELVEKIGIERDVSRSPLFDVVFAMENTAMDVGPQPEPVPRKELQPQPYQYKTNVSRFEMTLTAMEKAGKLNITFQYCTKLFDAETIYRLIGFFKEIVSTVLKNPREKISEISIISESDRKNLIKNIRDKNYNFMEADKEPSEHTSKLEADFDY
jgi:non-ribosomal peptide synthetase component F